MAIVIGDLLEVSIGMGVSSVTSLNVFQYEALTGSATATSSEVGEAWWNHVKATFRGIQTLSYGAWFRTVHVRELNNPTGINGEFSIPVGEAQGTRADPAQADPLPFFNAAGVRLSVGTLATRPGQKRFQCLCDGDAGVGTLQTPVRTAIGSLMDVLVADMVLGAPVALLTLRPIVVRKDPTGTVTAHQRITGYVINGQVTSQVSRKPGVGM